MTGCASRAFEFAPALFEVVFYNNIISVSPHNSISDKKYKTKNLTISEFVNNIGKFGYVEHIEDNKYLLYTNYRTMLNAGWKIEEIPPVPKEYLSKYKAVKIKTSFIVWAQLMTHTQLSKISQSDRVTGSEEYWLPEDVFTKIRSKREELSGTSLCFDRVTSTLHYGDFDGLLKILLTEVSQEDAQLFFKELGYKREIWSRAPYYFKMKTFIMGGWKNDPNAWENLFLERGVYPDKWKTWAQKETVEVAKMIEAVVNK